MTTVKRFEDLRAWQSARELVRMIYADSGQNDFGRDYGLKDQIRRAAVSVISNIAEGFNGCSDGDFLRFLGYARRSNSEVQSQAYIAMDMHYISPERFQSIYAKANLIERQLNALIAYLAKSRHAAIKEPSAAYNPSNPFNLQDLSDLSDLKDLTDQ
jgi:four helix bundle protein